MRQHRGTAEKTIDEISRYLSGACLFLSLRLFGQRGDPNATQPPLATLGMSLQELQLLRHDLRKQKQKLIAEYTRVSGFLS